MIEPRLPFPDTAAAGRVSHARHAPGAAMRRDIAARRDRVLSASPSRPWTLEVADETVEHEVDLDRLAATLAAVLQRISDCMGASR